MNFPEEKKGQSFNFALPKIHVFRAKECYLRSYGLAANTLKASGLGLKDSCEGLSMKPEKFIRIRVIAHKMRWLKFFAQDVRYYLNELSRDQ